MSDPEALDFEEFATRHGACKHDLGDVALHRSSEHVSRSGRKRVLALQAAKDVALVERRAGLRREYIKAVLSGRIRPLTARERLEVRAAGHPDRSSTQAARRLLEKLNQSVP